MTGGELLPTRLLRNQTGNEHKGPYLGETTASEQVQSSKLKMVTGFGISSRSLKLLPPTLPLKVIYSPFSQVLPSPQSSDFFLKRPAHTELCGKRQLLTDPLAKALASKTHLNSRHLVISFCRCITSYNRFWSCR